MFYVVEKITALARATGTREGQADPFYAAAQEARIHYYGDKLDDINVVVTYITTCKDVPTRDRIAISVEHIKGDKMCGLANSERILFYLMLLPNLDARISKVGMIAKLLKQTYIQTGGEECVMSTQEYIKNVLEDVGEDGDFKRGSWVSVIEYVNANGGIMSGCLGNIKNFFKNKCYTPNVLGNLKVTLKDLSDTIGGSIHHRVIDEEGYGKDITVKVALILANILVYSLKPSMHYLWLRFFIKIQNLKVTV
nr:hypothetical protein [Tanacetum cinerariifolium]